MPLIRRSSAGLCFLVGLFFGGPRTSPWWHACHGFLPFDAKPPSASMTRRRHRHHQQQVLTSLRMHPVVDLLFQQQQDWSVVPHSSEIITSSNLLLGTDATLHAMANVMDPTTTTTMTPMAPLLALPDSISNVVSPSAATASSSPSSSSAAGTLSPTTTVLVFVVGLIPFAVATVEFWRRVALRLPFGTGGGEDESVLIVIGDDDNRQLSRGRRVLGNDAIVVALVLFGVAAAVIGIVVASVLTSTPPPDTY
jgi:hypothetical protein